LFFYKNSLKNIKFSSDLMSKDIDTVLKFLIIGDSGVGKTCVLLRFCEDTFINVHLTTIGILIKKNLIFRINEFKLKELTLNCRQLN
jgi:GTPase SAR1 family protein